MKLTKFFSKIKFKKISNSNDAVVGIVVAVLLVGLLVTFMSIIQVHYVPKWMKENEGQHMDEVSNQFSQFKFAIDTQTALKQQDIPMTSPFTLGSTELPFFMSMPAYGQLNVIDDACNISFYNDSGGLLRGYDLGIVKFSSINAYLQNQYFIYEAGAVINSQNDGNIISVKPFFRPDENNDYNLDFKLIDIESIGGKTTSQTSTDSTAIQTEFSPNNVSKQIYNVTNITIKTDYINSWELFLNSTLKTIDWADVTDASSEVRISFDDNTTVNLDKYEIYAQIGPGWIDK
jgi:hypothetical protein